MNRGPYVGRGLLGIVLIVGLGIAIGQSSQTNRSTSSGTEVGLLQSAFLSDVAQHRNSADSFPGGEAQAVMGNLDLDLREAKMEADEAKLELTRLSHELSAAAPDPSASAAFRFVGLLDVPSSTPPVPSGRAPCSDGVSDSSRRKPVRKAG